MRRRAKITIDEAMAQINLVSSGSSRESSIAYSSDLASFSKDHGMVPAVLIHLP